MELHASGSPATEQVRKVRVLVVDDDAIFLELMAELLGEAGYIADVASSASETDEKLREFPDVKILLCDIDLRSNGNGVSIAQEARLLRPDLPILFISGHSAHLARSIMSDLNDVQFLQKPFRWEELATTLDEMLPA